MIVEVWEVYKRDSQKCVMYKTKDQAMNQMVFDEVDLMSRSKVDLTEQEIEELERGNPVFGW